MGQVIPRQHPAVVLKSHYKNLRALLAAALVAVVALTAAVVILSNDADQTASTQPISHQQALPDGTRYDGGPDEGTRGAQVNPAQASPLRSYEAQAGSQEPAGGPRFVPMGPSN
jgi:hypothetical protein